MTNHPLTPQTVTQSCRSKKTTSPLPSRARRRCPLRCNLCPDSPRPTRCRRNLRDPHARRQHMQQTPPPQFPRTTAEINTDDAPYTVLAPSSRRAPPPPPPPQDLSVVASTPPPACARQPGHCPSTAAQHAREVAFAERTRGRQSLPPSPPTTHTRPPPQHAREVAGPAHPQIDERIPIPAVQQRRTPASELKVNC
jgi:hypothetical protein